MTYKIMREKAGEITLINPINGSSLLREFTAVIVNVPIGGTKGIAYHHGFKLLLKDLKRYRKTKDIVITNWVPMGDAWRNPRTNHMLSTAGYHRGSISPQDLFIALCATGGDYKYESPVTKVGEKASVIVNYDGVEFIFDKEMGKGGLKTTLRSVDGFKDTMDVNEAVIYLAKIK